MRARVFAFWLAFATASTSFAQNAAYSQFPAASANTCATACTSDRMCASWSFGGTVPMVESTSRRSRNVGPQPRMCALSKSLTPVRQLGFESGLPRRSGALTPGGRYADGPANYEVRPAPWLDPGARLPQPALTYNQGAPIAPPPAMVPASVPSAGRVDFMPAQPNAAPTTQSTPTELSAPRAGARGTPRQQPAEQAARPTPQSYFGSRPMNVAPPTVAAAQPSVPPISYSPAPEPMTSTQQMQSPTTTQQSTDLSSFRGADGMVDAAAMRRSQINSARATGQPAYAVQREWEAVEAERQRALANGEVRADPLAGTVPVPESPQPKSTRPSPSYEPTESEPPNDNGQTDSGAQKPTSKAKGARGTPRAEQSNQARKSALADAARERARNPSFIDREPRLSGGPSG